MSALQRIRELPASHEAWAARRVGGLPLRWQKRLLSQHAEGLREDEFGANVTLRETVDKLETVRLTLDAPDDEIVRVADEMAAKCWGLASVFGAGDVAGARFAMERECVRFGIVPPDVVMGDTVDGVTSWMRRGKMKSAPAIARMVCGQWWRRQLRKMMAQTVEGAAIGLGYVNRARDLYVSNESLARRQQQIRRNARMMENTTLENELKQRYTLAELAAKGTANKAIRRGELMTRIAGFEVIARECGHDGLFLTLTCPSRMHKWSQVGGGRVVENRHYDGTSPRAAQKYLCRVWSRIRSAFVRAGVAAYGVRIAEPHHDACPHWHLLLFMEPLQFWDCVDIVNKYGLQDSPDEAGAWRHRVEAVRIDFESGSAAGYVAKYVAKNIDGLHVEDDLFGNPAMETSARVEAWASTWIIRQFQQIGGAPVGVWRELRRIREMAEDAPQHMRAAWVASNRIEREGEEVKAASYAEYTKAQGGAFIGRNARIQLEKEETGELGRYGEVKAARPVGVATIGARPYMVGLLKACNDAFRWVVESVRHVWRVVSSAEKSAPRTRVNNCTHEKPEKVSSRGWADEFFSPAHDLGFT